MQALFSRLRYAGVGAAVLLSGCNMEVLSPKGDVGAHEKSLILIALGLMAVVAIPVIAMTLWFAWRYRSSNKKATYAPNWSHSTKIEVVVWTIPAIIIVILAVITWTSSHALDPYKPLESEAKPVTVQVVSMDWKWLFVYPEYGVASVNELAFPTDRPVNFQITSDSVMNAFFIPQLGSQIYAMAGMETKLHLIAREPGTYAGLSSNFSGEGFSDMHFKAIATSEDGFNEWIAKAKASQASLDDAGYKALAQPSEKVPVAYYGNVAPNLFVGVINKHMGEMSHDAAMHGEMPKEGMHHDAPQESMQMDMHHHEGGDAVSSNITPAKAEK
ncbi:cytochrome bo3 quinol oxidase subunit 2 [Dyella jiangningensis]|uniref:ubiquinol oxidase subunit II n=1 Tax=Dyella sp. AtDHG13 TaxID=1938897 RepID=UPI00088C16B2|nr:ubiquinol oxidase subunit II [Dyella sp. AtDHG13]PXV61485.1 cytochrome bo3 quinol oxidase subunit 2 [Dyella sp. AtDHG13]SDJ74242.1 cytochrome bo3 quinol oxidase subunit 2 [Dyella jiangningensis]